MSTISVNPPKTPVTTGSDGVAAATVPNVCKMPGPPAPFVPTPLPNIARSGNTPKGFSKNVKFDGCAVAIKGATFTSVGDIASKGTGGGIVSSNVEGPAQFVGPGSLDVKVEGKNVHLLGDPMLNNCGPGGNPPNAATMVGLIQKPGLVALVGDERCPLCDKTHGSAVRLEETRATQGDASTFQAAAARARADGKVRGTMLGVIHCVDGMVFAANSGAQIAELQAHMPGGWHAPVPNRLTDFSRLVSADKQDRFEDIWKLRAGESSRWLTRKGAPLAGRTRQQAEKEAGEPCFPPGSCAAQKAVALALQHGARPVGLTERWSGSPGSDAKVFVHFRSNPKGDVRIGWFGGSQAVPPCKTCQVLLAVLLCPDERAPQCEHRSPGRDTCRCTT